MTVPLNRNWPMFALVLAIILLTCSACQNPDSGPAATPTPTFVTPITPADTPEMPARGYFKGFATVLPPDGNFAAAHTRAATHAEFANIWVGAADSGYWNLGKYLTGGWGSSFVEEFTRENGMFPIVNLSFIDKDPASGLLRLKVPEDKHFAGLSDPAFRKAYTEGAINAVRASMPLYLSLGNEVNRWYEQYGTGGANGFEHFLSLYEETYDAVKAISPQTQVFCIFAREIVDENQEASLDVLDLFDTAKLDLLAFTSYPFAVQGITSTSDIPDDYYFRAIDRIPDSNMPFGFTELAWSTADAFGGEPAQARFLSDAVSRLTIDRGMDLHLLGWWSLFDLEADPHGTGLITVDGREKPAYEVWKKM